MLSEKIQESEELYRAVKRSKPDWLDGRNIPTSAMFKEANGVSVDRDGGRNEPEIIRFMCDVSFPKRLKGIIKISAEECFLSGCEVKAAPSENNPYHANIFLEASDMRRKNIQALKLAKASKLIFFDKTKEWT